MNEMEKKQQNKMPNSGQPNPLGTAPVGALLRKFAIPSIIAMLVGGCFILFDNFLIV